MSLGSSSLSSSSESILADDLYLFVVDDAIQVLGQIEREVHHADRTLDLNFVAPIQEARLLAGWCERKSLWSLKAQNGFIL